MSFLIRQVSHTADGREIVRTRRVDKPMLVVGRAAESDIHLLDLAVEPQHAAMVQTGSRTIEVSSLNGLAFEFDGRSVLSTAIDAANGAELRFGGHRLTIGHENGDPEDAGISIAVQRVDALSDASEEKDEARVFSLRGTMFSKRDMAWLFAVAILIGFLALPVWAYFHGAHSRSIYGIKADRAWSPGPLSVAHHSLETKCEVCHVKAFVSVRDTACKTCHKNVHDHGPPVLLAAARGEKSMADKLMARIAHAFGKPEQGCVDCHSEHESEGRMPPTAQVFCADCHGQLKEHVPGAGIRDASDFGTAHPEFMPAVMRIAGVKPSLARVSLAEKPRDVGGLKFPHDLHLSTTNGVARMAQTMGGRFGFGGALACKDCHTPTADGVRFQPVEMEKNCSMCHSLAFDKEGGTFRTLRHGDPRQVVADIRALYRLAPPERPMDFGGIARRRPGQYAEGQVYSVYFGAAVARPGLAEGAVTAVFSQGGACYDCHTVTPPGVRGVKEWTVTPVHQTMRYMTKGWFSHEAHKIQSCSSCHAAGKSASADDLLLPDIGSCRNCHGGEASNAKVPSSCAVCHSYHIGTGAPWVSALQVARSRTGSDMTRARGKPGS